MFCPHIYRWVHSFTGDSRKKAFLLLFHLFSKPISAAQDLILSFFWDLRVLLFWQVVPSKNASCVLFGNNAPQDNPCFVLGRWPQENRSAGLGQQLFMFFRLSLLWLGCFYFSKISLHQTNISYARRLPTDTILTTFILAKLKRYADGHRWTPKIIFNNWWQFHVNFC